MKRLIASILIGGGSFYIVVQTAGTYIVCSGASVVGNCQPIGMLIGPEFNTIVQIATALGAITAVGFGTFKGWIRFENGHRDN